MKDWKWYNYLGLPTLQPKRQKLYGSGSVDGGAIKPHTSNAKTKFSDTGFGITIGVLLILSAIGAATAMAVLLANGIIRLVGWLTW